MKAAIRRLAERLSGRYRRLLARQFGRRLYRMRNDRPFISFTFDDFPVSALTTGGGILERYGLAATFYASMGLMGQDAPAGRLFSPADLKALVAAGHELGCHTFSHSHAWDTPSRVFEESLLENQRALSNLLPGEVFRTMSYPIGCPRPETKRATAKHFACCRGGGQRFNVGSIDLNYLSAYFLEQDVDGVGSVWSVLDRSCREAGWLILATHDVCDQPSPFGCTPEFFEEVVRYTVRSGAIILPVGQAWELIRKGHGC